MTTLYRQEFTVAAWMTRVIVTLALACSISLPAGAADEMPGPGKVIEQATGTIMSLAAQAPSYFDEDPDRFINAVGDELDKVVDFRGFARGVMGDYASSERYKSLDEAGREALRDQLDRFTVVLREALINTYARGLLAFGGSKLELAETEFAPNNKRVASVLQRVVSPEGKVYAIRYQLGQYRDGSWLLRNMIIENINLGEIYRGQFEDAAQQRGGDLDAVIEGWREEGLEVQEGDSERASK